MKKLYCFILVIVAAVCFTQFSYAAGQGGKEHGGTITIAQKEHGGTSTSAKKEHGGTERKEAKGSGRAEPKAHDIRQAMKNYVMEKSKATGTFDVQDSETGTTRKLSLKRVHERVGKTGDYYYSCADFTDTNTGELLDLDLDVEQKGGKLSVVDVRIHKVGGKERYTYDENDNRIPLQAKTERKGSGSKSKGSGY